MGTSINISCRPHIMMYHPNHPSTVSFCCSQAMVAVWFIATSAAHSSVTPTNRSIESKARPWTPTPTSPSGAIGPSMTTALLPQAWEYKANRLVPQMGFLKKNALVTQMDSWKITGWWRKWVHEAYGLIVQMIVACVAVCAIGVCSRRK